MIPVVLFAASLMWATCADLPDYFPRCYRNDNDLENCLINGSENMKPFLKTGFSEFKIPSIDPLVLEVVEIAQQDVDFKFTARLLNMTFGGLTNYTFEELKFHPDTLTLQGRVLCPLISVVAKARFRGKVVVVSVNGDTEFALVMGPTVTNFTIGGKLEKRGNEDYFVPTKIEVAISIADGSIGKLNILNESGFMSELTRIMANANFEFMALKLAVIYEEIGESVLSSLLAKLTNEVPYNKLLPLR